MTKGTILGAVFALLQAASLLAQTKTGTTVWQFLLIEPSARITGMGNAGTTLYNEPEAVYYNPAGLGLLPRNGVQFTHSTWLADITYDYAAVALVLGDVGNLYGSVTALNSGEIAVTTVNQPLGTGEKYTVSDIAFGIGYGRQISERFSVGVLVSYLQETIWHSSMSAFALNVGTIYRLAPDGLHIGASISNFGTRAKYDGRDLRIFYNQDPTTYGHNTQLPAELYMEDFPLPILFRVGVGMPVSLADDYTLEIAADAYHPSDNTESVSLGAELMAFNVFSLRGGFQHLGQQDREGGLTLGAGLQYDMGGYRINFDYAWADAGRLENTQRVTLGVSF